MAELGERACAAAPEEAARAGDWVGVSIQSAPYRELPAAAPPGKVVLDIGASVTRRTTNPRTAAPGSSSHVTSRHVGASKLVSEAVATAVEAGRTGLHILRADSQFYNAGVIAACRRAGAHLSITCGMNPSTKRAVLAIDDTGWQQITYPTAVPDPDTGELI
ncbi:hypothetical protein [Streptomyces sp. NBC_00582]|uniref:hypothetical protein n=1 Tax=Streptomyces sp. NBC_00582 TaxID=2975783 RepID=UPI002E822C06|nr:hypothetical protein [Streptomyces sp. NBC_00582]WUB67554.1 hypothetical protein OG852_47815 [Streptomyces sp. NBC_00582]